MIIFAHTKFGLLRIKGEADSPRPERVFEMPAWIGLRQCFISGLANCQFR